MRLHGVELIGSGREQRHAEVTLTSENRQARRLSYEPLTIPPALRLKASAGAPVSKAEGRMKRPFQKLSHDGAGKQRNDWQSNQNNSPDNHSPDH